MTLSLASACSNATRAKISKPVPAAVTRADKVYMQGANMLAGGDSERALELFTAAWKESPGHTGVAQDFTDALAELKKSGDNAFRHNRPEEAGRKWAAVLHHMGHPAARTGSLPFTRAEVRGSIDKLSESLMEKALVEYRQGNLGAAIGHWRAILAYDPGHADAARSLNTATTQLENLKKLAPGK